MVTNIWWRVIPFNYGHPNMVILHTFRHKFSIFVLILNCFYHQQVRYPNHISLVISPMCPLPNGTTIVVRGWLPITKLWQTYELDHPFLWIYRLCGVMAILHIVNCLHKVIDPSQWCSYGIFLLDLEQGIIHICIWHYSSSIKQSRGGSPPTCCFVSV